jgi:hypothetical protein
LFERDLFRKPASTFRDHALMRQLTISPRPGPRRRCFCPDQAILASGMERAAADKDTLMALSNSTATQDGDPQMAKALEAFH